MSKLAISARRFCTEGISTETRNYREEASPQTEPPSRSPLERGRSRLCSIETRLELNAHIAFHPLLSIFRVVYFRSPIYDIFPLYRDVFFVFSPIGSLFTLSKVQSALLHVNRRQILQHALLIPTIIHDHLTGDGRHLFGLTCQSVPT